MVPKAKKSKKKKSAPTVKKAKGKAAKDKRKLGKKSSGIVYFGLGSNVGDREEYIEQAIFLLEKINGVTISKKSSNYETEAEGVADQPPFLNAVVEAETTLTPHKLLEALQGIEETLGRERGAEWGPRTIDLDILLYDDQIVSDDKLQIPHPLLHERMFVLRPLVEIAPDVLHPTLERTASELYEEKKAELGDKYDDELPGFKQIKQGRVDDYERW
jgi:2-amino-4-hydroxy-6-hydroxymethyldihydropteridine diphosphokinase